MARWLVAEGVAPGRLNLEPQAEDTLGNAVYSLPILGRLAVGSATLVSSSYHVRRGLILLRTIAARYGLAICFNHLAAADPDMPAIDTPAGPAELEIILGDFERALTCRLEARPGAATGHPARSNRVTAGVGGAAGNG